MSYREEEKKIQWKLRRIKWIVFAVVFFIVLAVSIFSAFVPPKTWKYYFNLPSVSARRAGELRIHCLDVGQGDCTLIEFPDGKTMLVDGGDGTEGNTTKIMRYLNALKIDYIHHVVLTHTDADHCGGLDTILQYKDVGTVYYPTDKNVSVNKEYASFFAELTKRDKQKNLLNRQGIDFSSSNEKYPYSVVWLRPRGSEVGREMSSNEASAVIWIDYGERETLLMGDAPKSVEKSLCDISEQGLLPVGVDISSIDLLKVSHHGSMDATSKEFVSYIHAKNALVSCGANNVYGHPAPTTLTNLENVSVYRTDTQGDVIFTWKADGSEAVKTTR